MTPSPRDRARVLHVSACAATRLAAARDWLTALPAHTPALLLIPNANAGSWLIADVLHQPGAARFAWRRRTLEQHAHALATPALLASERSFASGIAVHAVCSRVLNGLRERDQLGRFSVVAAQPGFVRALAKTLLELRLALVTPEQLALRDPDLARCLEAYATGLAESGLCDLPDIYALAHSAAAEQPAQQLFAWDVPITSAAEARLLGALCASATRVWAGVPVGDGASLGHFRSALGEEACEQHAAPRDPGDLGRLQAHLFASERPPSAAPPAAGDERVRFIASPGESRESVEVVRELQRAAQSGVRFDRMAVLVHAVDNYRAFLEEAFARADIPAHFDSGVRRPAPEGRAFALLLACAEHGLSARRFGEYLSLGVAPRAELAGSGPRHWERLLIAASVSGSRAHWERRLQGLAHTYRDELAALAPEAARREALERQLAALDELTQFALPVLDALEALPEQASCDVWCSALSALAERALREPSGVCELLQSLSPLAARTQLGLREVARLLAPHLNSLIVTSEGHGAGRVFVAGIDQVRGRSFERVFVLGLAERLFPTRLTEDPLLPDRTRRALSPALACMPERIAAQRLSLHLAAGAASDRLCFTFPSFDTEHARPRVPSFYGLDALEAIHGRLLGWSELQERAEPGAAARLGWPAPESPELAIDDAEYDLAVLAGVARAPEQRVGALRYLLDANPQLGRALRSRARRWELPKFVAADGFVLSDTGIRELFKNQALEARSYSPSSLEQLAICPYRFYLHAIARVGVVDGASEPSELAARERGLLFHEVLHGTFQRLLQAAPPSAADPELPRRTLDAVFSEVSGRVRERYAPAITRVFDAALSSVHRDLSGLVERIGEDPEWVPFATELPLGGGAADSRGVALELGARVSGVIDLVEQKRGAGPMTLRATDFKTGAPHTRLAVSSGGHVLQPLLYALALERMYPDATVEGGRLYFCTREHHYESQAVPLGERARGVAKDIFQAAGELLSQGFLPAAPENGACASCSFRDICGPHEEERVQRVKHRDQARLRGLQLLRRLP